MTNHEDLRRRLMILVVGSMINGMFVSVQISNKIDHIISVYDHHLWNTTLASSLIRRPTVSSSSTICISNHPIHSVSPVKITNINKKNNNKSLWRRRPLFHPFSERSQALVNIRNDLVGPFNRDDHHINIIIIMMAARSGDFRRLIFLDLLSVERCGGPLLYIISNMKLWFISRQRQVPHLTRQRDRDRHHQVAYVKRHYCKSSCVRVTILSQLCVVQLLAYSPLILLYFDCCFCCCRWSVLNFNGKTL